MDGIIITAALVLAVIAVIGIVSLFVALPSEAAPAYAAVLPVFPGDDSLPERLEYLSMKGSGRRRVILVDYGATCEQAEMCRRFVQSSPDAVFISASELEKLFSEIFVR